MSTLDNPIYGKFTTGYGAKDYQWTYRSGLDGENA